MIRLFLILAVPLAAAAPLHAQPWASERIGMFWYNPSFDQQTGRDESSAYVRAALNGEPVEQRGGAGGDLRWYCRDSLLIYISIPRVHPGARSRMIYAFDDDAPDTVDVAQPWPAIWGLPAERNRAFTARARTARQLSVQLVNGSRRTSRVFELDSADRVLGRLACVRELEPPLPPDAREVDLADVDDPPLLVNYVAVRQALAREYTPEQREAGVSGWVELSFRVMEDGSLDPASVTVLRSSDPQFEAGSIRVVRMMRFEPGRVNGRAVITRATQMLQYQADMFSPAPAPPD
jgi:TonB family protein